MVGRGLALAGSLALGACGSAPFASASATYSIPLLDTGRWGTVMMNVDGTSELQRLVFDTAAGGHVLDRAAAGRLNLLEGAQKAGGTVVGAGGEAAGGQRVTARNVSLSGLSLGDTGFLIFDLSPFSKHGARIDGIIGNGLFERYSVLFDAPNGRLTFSESTGASTTRGFVCQPNAAGAGRPSELQNFPIALVQIGSHSDAFRGVPATAVVDTGSTETTLNWPAANAVGIRKGDPALRPRQQGARGLDGNARTSSYLYTLPYLKVGDRIIRNLDVEISPLPVFRAVRLEERPAMILGMTVLRAQPVAIEKGANRICFGPGVA